MRARRGVSPVLVELLIAALFFALASTVVVRALLAAETLSRESEIRSRALLLAQDEAARLELGPASGPELLDGTRTERFERDGFLLEITILRAAGGTGALYDYTVEVFYGDESVASFGGARYFGGEAGA